MNKLTKIKIALNAITAAKNGEALELDILYPELGIYVLKKDYMEFVGRREYDVWKELDNVWDDLSKYYKKLLNNRIRSRLYQKYLFLRDLIHKYF